MNAARSSGPLTRREFLRIGSLALGGLALSDVLAARAAAGTVNSDTSTIFLYLHGGASQLETYDLKPQAPIEYRSVFNPIPTNVPGIDVCELFPRHAAVADKFSLVRSLNHDIGIHSDGGIIVMTGKRPSVLDPTSQSKSEHPDFGSIASRVRGMGANAIPPYVGVPSHPNYTRPTYLGRHHAAFDAGDPSSANYAPLKTQISVGRDAVVLENRKALLGDFDRLRKDLDQNGQLEAAGEFRARAFELLTSSETASAFDLSKEDDRLRDRYGRNLWGQGCLLARRLAEAGAAVINLTINTPKDGPSFTNWDDHILNAQRPGHFGDYMRTRLPYLDHALATLIEDVFERGLDKKILIVVVGEFGRTPRLSHNAQGTGRDHWPQAYSALISGGGLRMGQVIGATNSKAEFPTEKPYTPQDLLATVYRHLGIDPSRNLLDHSGRPIAILSEGRPIVELL